MGLKYSDIEWAFDVTSLNDGMSDVSVAVHVPTGKMYMNDEFGFMEFDESQRLPQDAYGNDDYVWIPDRKDLNLGTALVFKFIEMEMPEHFVKVENIFGRRGAYRHFKNFLESKQMLNQWHDFEQSESKYALLRWCQENGIELEDVKEVPIQNEFLVSTDRVKLDIPVIHKCLSEDSYWAQGRTIEQVVTAFDKSLSFGVYNRDDDMVGFCRVLTDYVAFAYLMDVYVLPQYRGKGVGHFLLKKVFAHRDLQNIQCWMLGTRDAHGVYRDFGFEKLKEPQNFMQRFKE